jgi:hypothetical protein
VDVRQRFSTRNPGEVTGYAVALPGDTANDGGPVWYGGGKLAADLTWPKLRHRWSRPGTAPGERLSAGERDAAWDHAARTAAGAAAQIRFLSGTDPAVAADAAWAAADTLHVAAAALGSRILRQAADAYDRAARAPCGRIPRPTRTGDSLRRAARLIGAFACLTDDRALAPLVLIMRLAALAEAVAGLRDAQQHAAQAAAARSAAERLYAAAGLVSAAQPPARPRAPTPAQLAGQSFPAASAPGATQRAPGQRRPDPPAPRPSRGQSTPRPRGPGR